MPSLETFPDLETPRLRLREIVLSDGAAYLAIFGNAEHMHLFGVDPVPDLGAAENLITAFAGSHVRENPHLRWGIESKTQPGLMGSCGLFAWNKKWNKCSVGFALAAELQGNGYINEALSAVLSWGFAFLGLNRIDAQVHVNNSRSLRVLDRLKFVNEGRLRQFCFWDGQYHDMFQYSLLRADWVP
jgi:ribosomal-protein-alanine N-acetyltransferase